MPGPLLTFVDDSEADHLLIQDALETLNIPVRSQHFVQVSQFLAALDCGEITQDAVITDLNMPGPSGFDLLQAIRSRHPGQTLPILIFSTSPAAADRALAAALDVDGYFVKPVSYDGLVAQLREMVDLVLHCQKRRPSSPQPHPSGPWPVLADALA